ncbi:probable ribosomal silencing factor RsfS at C-terminar half [Coccomyxa sp. Obi]|nr:probable ribosomal silencing factor RsfS at C-terminar half [Coccomyxa sp. Obi]
MLFARIVAHSRSIFPSRSCSSLLAPSSATFGHISYTTETSLEQDTLVWPPPGHAISENPALQKLLQAQHAKNRKEQDEAAAERMQTGLAAQSSGCTIQAPANDISGAFLAVRDALKERRSADLPIRSPKDLSDLRLVDLRPILAQLGLKTNGTKALLIDRLWSALVSEGFPARPAERWMDNDIDSEEGTEGATQQYAHVVTGEEVAEMLRDAKTDDVRVIDVRQRDCDFTDEFVIATARSKLHAQTAAQAVVYRIKERCKEVAPGVVPSVEGLGTSSYNNSEWLVVDCGSVVAHVFEQDSRKEYDLDSMWGGPGRSLEAA